jgi:hypothetical protein
MMNIEDTNGNLEKTAIQLHERLRKKNQEILISLAQSAQLAQTSKLDNKT